MPRVLNFYSSNEAAKPAFRRVYHNNGACPPGRAIPDGERVAGMNNYRLCEGCDRLNSQGTNARAQTKLRKAL